MHYPKLRLPYPFPFPSDTNLTKDSVTAVMEEVKEWQRVSFELLIPDHILNQQGLSEGGKKDVIGNYYLQTHPNASMEHLARELYLAGEYNAVEKAKRYLPRGVCTHSYTRWDFTQDFMFGGRGRKQPPVLL